VLRDQVRNSPVPAGGGPATAGGTINDAYVFRPVSNMVTSYATVDVNNGMPLVVNIIGPTGQFGPGYVVRFVNNGVAHTAGTETSAIQSQWFSPGSRLGILTRLAQDAANQWGWGTQMEDWISRCTCRRAR
jgi:hypothetical protein